MAGFRSLGTWGWSAILQRLGAWELNSLRPMGDLPEERLTWDGGPASGSGVEKCAMIVGRVWDLGAFIGIGIGALITGYVPRR